jgi:hypothetical protein
MTQQHQNPVIIEDIWDNIVNDGWMWICVQGVKRLGKTTVAGNLAFEIYKAGGCTEEQAWLKVLGSIVFDLNQVMYNIEKGLPERWPTHQGFNKRIPVMIWDDMAAHFNKAKVRDNKAADAFKGYFHTMATDVAVLIGTMEQGEDITRQLKGKYTHEIWLDEDHPRKYKYDKAKWQQNFKGWEPRIDKKWREDWNNFYPWPKWAYEQYNEQRRELSDELRQTVVDAQTIHETPNIIKLLDATPIDKEALEFLLDNGMTSRDVFERKYPDDHIKILRRLKSRKLIAPIAQKSYYSYELTEFGMGVTQKIRKHSQTPP